MCLPPSRHAPDKRRHFSEGTKAIRTGHLGIKKNQQTYTQNKLGKTRELNTSLGLTSVEGSMMLETEKQISSISEIRWPISECRMLNSLFSTFLA